MSVCVCVYVYNLYFNNLYYQTWPIKWKQFLPGSGSIDTAVWMHYLDTN